MRERVPLEGRAADAEQRAQRARRAARAGAPGRAAFGARHASRWCVAGVLLGYWLLTTVGGRDLLLAQIVARLPAGATLTLGNAPKARLPGR